ncbi:MAG TPA: FkbM family methyltransferase [Leeuwenhoekiella sp.]|nr:FkbM family methyltransferase [Leeuwenhoekiella sp.]
MKKTIKRYFKNLLFKSGYKINRIDKNYLLDDNPFRAVKSFLTSEDSIFFDIGVNHGQSLHKIRKYHPNAFIHGFEPSKYCFQELIRDFNSDKIILNNFAVGDKNGISEFNEYSWDSLNSLLKRAYTKSKIVETYQVDVISVDNYCEKNKIDHIHFLKTDTEGYELNVLKGAERLMKNNKIKFVLIELFFDLNFIGQSAAGDIFNFLEKNNFKLVRFYAFSYSDKGLSSKTDALFINTKFK